MIKIDFWNKFFFWLYHVEMKMFDTFCREYTDENDNKNKLIN